MKSQPIMNDPAQASSPYVKYISSVCLSMITNSATKATVYKKDEESFCIDIKGREQIDSPIRILVPVLDILKNDQESHGGFNLHGHHFISNQDRKKYSCEIIRDS
jgi:hypothetical protein